MNTVKAVIFIACIIGVITSMTGIKLEAANLTALAERLSAAAPAKL